MCFEDEAGFTRRPPKGRTWGRRGRTPVVTVSGRRSGRLSVAGLIAWRPGSRTRLCHRLRRHPAGKGKRLSIGERDFIVLIDGVHQLVKAPIVLVWDRLNTHVSHAMRELIAEREWLTVFLLPAYSPDLNPVEGVWAHVKRSLANHRRRRPRPPASAAIPAPVGTARRRPRGVGVEADGRGVEVLLEERRRIRPPTSQIVDSHLVRELGRKQEVEPVGDRRPQLLQDAGQFANGSALERNGDLVGALDQCACHGLSSDGGSSAPCRARLPARPGLRRTLKSLIAPVDRQRAQKRSGCARSPPGGDWVSGP
ncbi:transposase [Streptomyces sp. NPDC007905]|uniref:transposase n=1 Tax=Streptomyces sp. NPDC007905 TaxID=3364788 RepID=UPI0036E6A581